VPAYVAYGTTATTGANNYVVFAAANATSVTVYGLSASTSYTADVYSYNVGTVAGFENYNPAGGTSGAFTTLPQPALTAGTLMVEENFDYAAATALTAQGWTVAGANANPVISTTAGNNLSTTYPRGAALSATPAGTSSKAALASSGQDLYRTGVRPASSNVTYGAAIINVSAAQATGDYFTGFNPSGTATNYRNRVYIKSSGTGFVMGLSAGNETEVYATPVFSFNTNYVLVLKYENSAATGNLDVANIFLLPIDTDLRQEPNAPLLTVSTTNAANPNLANTITGMLLRQGNSSNAATLTIDGIRLATGWGAALGRPIFTSPFASIAAGSYYDVAVNNAASVTATGPVNVEDNLTLTSGNINTTTTNLLKLYEGTTITGGSNSSLVNGPVARVISTTGVNVPFPIGSGSQFRPVALNVTSQAAATTYTARVTNQNSGRGIDNTNGGALTRVSAQRYFTISENGTSNFQNGVVTLSFSSGDGVTDLNTLRIARSANGSSPYADVNPAGTPVVTGTPAAGAIAAVTSALGDFALATTATDFNNPLPVELTKFAAQRQSAGVALQWATASEKNSAYFDVQRSTTGAEFATVARVLAQGNSAQPTAYTSFDDKAPAAALYYRLRQVDTDGTVSYSPVLRVSGSKAELAFFPNPAHSTLSVISQDVATYRVLNQLGQVLLQGRLEAGNSTVDVARLAAGLYHLEVQTASGRTVHNFTKE